MFVILHLVQVALYLSCLSGWHVSCRESSLLWWWLSFVCTSILNLSNFTTKMTLCSLKLHVVDCAASCNSKNWWACYIHIFMHMKKRIMPLCCNKISNVLFYCFNCLHYLKTLLSVRGSGSASSFCCILVSFTPHIYQAIIEHVFQCCVVATKLSCSLKFSDEFSYAFSLLSVSHVEFTMLVPINNWAAYLLWWQHHKGTGFNNYQLFCICCEHPGVIYVKTS